MRKITECINTQLNSICLQVLTLETLTERIKVLLPSSLQDHCTVASFNRGCLMLVTQDAVWASQLRYFLPELREKLRIEGFPQLTAIKIAMHLDGIEHPEKSKKEAHLSIKATEIITQGASIQTYDPLRKALMKLANKQE